MTSEAQIPVEEKREESKKSLHDQKTIESKKSLHEQHQAEDKKSLLEQKLESKKSLHEQKGESKKTLHEHKEEQKGESKKSLHDQRRKSFAENEARRRSTISEGKKSVTTEDRAMSRLRVRKQSYGFSRVPGVTPLERSSQFGLEFKRPPLIYLPTYQLDPTVKFNRNEVLKVIEEILDQSWDGHKYNPETPALAIRLAGDIMRRIKTMGFQRYRIISVVTIGQKRSQCYTNTISFIMDSERDSYCDTHRENPSAFVQVTVFGVYLD